MNSRILETLKSSVVIFQALETSSAELTSLASATSVASTAFKCQFPQKEFWSWWSGTKITNTGHFVWNGPHKIQFFTNVWHSLSQRLLRPREVKKVSNDGTGINSYHRYRQQNTLMSNYVHWEDVSSARWLKWWSFLSWVIIAIEGVKSSTKYAAPPVCIGQFLN